MAVFDDGGLVLIARTGAELDDGVDEQATDEREEDDHEPDGVHEDIELHLRDRTLGVHGRLTDGQIGLRATGHDDGQEGGGEQTDPTEDTRKHKGGVSDAEKSVKVW